MCPAGAPSPLDARSANAVQLGPYRDVLHEQDPVLRDEPFEPVGHVHESGSDERGVVGLHRQRPHADDLDPRCVGVADEPFRSGPVAFFSQSHAPNVASTR